MKTKRTSTPEPRNLGVTVLAGVLFILSALMATSFYDGSWLSIAGIVVLSFIALLSLAVAISGRVKWLLILIESLFFVSLS